MGNGSMDFISPGPQVPRSPSPHLPAEVAPTAEGSPRPPLSPCRTVSLARSPHPAACPALGGLRSQPLRAWPPAPLLPTPPPSPRWHSYPGGSSVVPARGARPRPRRRQQPGRHVQTALVSGTVGSSSGTVCFVKWGALPPGAPCLGLTACPLVRRPSMPAPFSSGLGSRQEVPGVHLSCSPA